MKRPWVVVLLCAFACVWACKKSEKKQGAAGSGGSAAADPWADHPDAVDTKLGAATGDEFAKIAPGAPTQALAAKVDVNAIEKPDAPKVALRSFSSAGNSGFIVTYNDSTNAAHEQFRSALQGNHVFETVAEGLNKTIRLPTQVDIEVVDCNTINAFYDPNTKRIIVCYELLDYFLEVFKPNAKSDDDLGNAVVGATLFSFYHEAGHGLIHILDLPAVGREEDSVDQLATLTLIAMGDEGVQMALSGAYWFQLQSQQANHDTPFWDEHAFDGQRFYNIVCLIYGSAPDKYGQFVTSGVLPADRAQRCPGEYEKINKAWQKLLQPYLTNGAAANVDYQPAVAVAEAPKSTASDPWGDEPATPTPETPEAPPADDAAITCEQVGTRVAELIGAEAEKKAANMSATELAELKAQLESQLPAVMEQLLAQCAKENWPQAGRKCVLDATTLDEAGKCQ
jgi:hypothetical protein